MKSLLFSLLLPWCIVMSSMAENNTDSALYKTGLKFLNSAETEAQFIEAADYFLKIAGTDSSNWLPYYYAGLCFNMASGSDPKSKAKDQLIDRAEKELEKAVKLNPGNPELTILQAFIWQARIQIDPIVRGMSYSSKANTLLDEALKADPGNPRAIMLKAFNIYYTPELLKGGASNALPVFIEAKKMFASYVPDSEIYPQWGEKETVNMISVCEKEITVQ